MARKSKDGKDSKPAETAIQQELREQEVLRAKRELAAYFNGRRTEREARAALKTIKAFIRHRERTEPELLRPLPGAKSGRSSKTRKPAAEQ